VLKAGWGIEVILYRLAQNSALLLALLSVLPPVLEPVLEPLQGRVLLLVPRPLLGPPSVSELMPEPVLESVCSREQKGQPYILFH
jgi:hypothetical protein